MNITNINKISNYSPKTEFQPQKNKQNSVKFEYKKEKETTEIAQNRPYQIHKANFVALKDKNGNEVKAVLIHNKRSKSMYLMRGQDVLGGMLYSITSASIKGDNYPDYYKNKKYLFINQIYSHKKYKGIGTELIKKLVHESKKQGYEGRVCLNTSTTKPEKGSPIPFYYKLGFEASNKQKHEEIKKALEAGKKIPASCESVTLFLPENAIKKLSCDS